MGDRLASNKYHEQMFQVRINIHIEDTDSSPTYGLEAPIVKNLGKVHRNLPVPKLVEHAIAKGEGILSDFDALCLKTGQYTASPEMVFSTLKGVATPKPSGFPKKTNRKFVSVPCWKM